MGSAKAHGWTRKGTRQPEPSRERHQSITGHTAEPDQAFYIGERAILNAKLDFQKYKKLYG